MFNQLFSEIQAQAKHSFALGSCVRRSDGYHFCKSFGLCVFTRFAAF